MGSTPVVSLSSFVLLSKLWCLPDHMWCDVGESETLGVELVTFWVFYLKYSLLGEVHFAENPTWIGPVTGSKITAKFWKILKAIENPKKKHSFFWLYLTINAPNFRPIPLDRNTYSRIHIPLEVYNVHVLFHNF